MSLQTPYAEIVDVAAIGGRNTRNLGDILVKATAEGLPPSKEDVEKVLLLAIDMQKDFMENGSLPVPGSFGDVERTTKFIYDNLSKISQIAVSLDTHLPQQIFHPYWWVDSKGNNPAPYTVITLKDLDEGKWFPVIAPMESREYVEGLEKQGKVLCIWTYHCIQGTEGHSLESQFANMIYFHSDAKKMAVHVIAKGQDPLSEMYGIIKPEFSRKNLVNTVFLNYMEKFDKIIIVGEAKSHCVLESIKQIAEHYHNVVNKPEMTQKVYILEDCMSCIPGFEQPTEAAFNTFKQQYRMNILKSTDLKL
jgi:nicotinamidase-related amidase